MEQVLRGLCAVIGVLVVLGTTSMVIRALVVPRGMDVASTRVIMRAVLAIFRAGAKRCSTYQARDALLTWAGAVMIVASLLAWLFMYFCGYGLIIFGTSSMDIGVAFREGGSSLFTLGFASTDRLNLTAVDFMAAATGPIVIGLLVGYLPALYAAYQRRETEVTLLHARSGEPNWGPELLGRHAIVNTVPELGTLWPVWERWCADVGESHTNFPVLIHMRSSRPQRNWLVALICILDAAAMHMSLNPQLPSGRSRVVLRQGAVCLQELAEAEGIPFDADPDPDTPSAVTLEDFVAACDMLRESGYEMTRSPEDAYAHFRGWRANYEPIAFELAARIDAVPAAWTGPRRPHLDTIYPHRPQNRVPGGGSAMPE